MAVRRELLLKLYIDESGQSGADLYDAAQPVYAIAALWIPASADTALAALVDRVRRENGIVSSELKGSRLIGSGPGRRAIQALIDGSLELGIETSFAVFHKPFMAAAVVIEDCTDPVHNSNFSNQWTWDTTIKEPLAEAILDHVEATILRDWWKARRGEKFQDFVEAHSSLVQALQTDRELKKLAGAITATDLDAIWEPKAVRARLQNGGYSPNLAVFAGLLPALDQQTECTGATNVPIIHDQQNEFEIAYRNAFATALHASKLDVTLPNRNSIRLPLQRLASLQFIASNNCLALQLADCMASLARAVIQAGVTPAAQLSGVPRTFRRALKRIDDAKSGPHLPFVAGPLSWQAHAFNALIGGEPLQGHGLR